MTSGMRCASRPVEAELNPITMRASPNPMPTLSFCASKASLRRSALHRIYSLRRHRRPHKNRRPLSRQHRPPSRPRNWRKQAARRKKQPLPARKRAGKPEMIWSSAVKILHPRRLHPTRPFRRVRRLPSRASKSIPTRRISQAWATPIVNPALQSRLALLN